MRAMPSVEYDSTVLQKFADRLYRAAEMVVFWTAAKYTVGGFLVGVISAAVDYYAEHTTAHFAVATIPVSVVGLALGIRIGRERAFDLRFRAQQLLVQLQIERNTRQAKAAQA